MPLSIVRLAPTRTDKVPNTSATAASSGADLNGGAVKNACEQIQARLAEVAAEELGVHPADVRFVDGKVTGLGADRELIFAELVNLAYHQRVQLWAAGFYRTAGLHWDAKHDARLAVQVLRLRRRGQPRSRSTGSPAPTGCAGSTSCTTSATACPRWSTSARSRAGSCRAPAG